MVHTADGDDPLAGLWAVSFGAWGLSDGRGAAGTYHREGEHGDPKM
jgi:uncharacterized protein with beta-barrel porin domain